MNIPAVSSEAISPGRLLRQLRETSNDQIPPAFASAEVTLSPDARLAGLLERLLGGEGAGIDAGRVVRLLGQSALFASAANSGATVPLPLVGTRDPNTGEALSLQEVGRDGFSAERLGQLLRNSAEVLPLVQASITANGLDALFESAANDRSALPATIRLYLDNGGVPGVRLEAPEPAIAVEQLPLF